MKYSWQRGLSSDLYVDETGKIVGEVSAFPGYSYANVHEKSIGKYVTRDDAKRAVERAVQDMEAKP